MVVLPLPHRAELRRSHLGLPLLQRPCVPAFGEGRSDFARLPGHRRAPAAAPREPPHRRDFRGHEPPQERRLARVLVLVDGRAVHGRDHAALPRALEPAGAIPRPRTFCRPRMKSYQVTVLIMAIGLAVGILYLVRRDHIYIRQGLFWIVVAVISLGLGVWPVAIDVIGEALGVAYPPTLLLLVAIIVLMLKGLLGDIGLTRLRRDMRRLNQRIALLEGDQLENRKPGTQSDYATRNRIE